MAGRLTALKLKSLTKPGLHSDGGGLYVQVTKGGAKSWILRYRLHGRDRYMGLGPLAYVSLAEAREAAAAARKLARQEGVDPIDARASARAAANAARGLNTFREVASAYIAAHTPGWRNEKHARQWTSTLETYVYPVFGDWSVATVGTAEVTRVLEALWTAKPETASRVRGRIEQVLDYAAARGWRHGDNPARWRGHLDNLFPARGKVRRVQHHAAVPWRQVGTCLDRLRHQQGMAAKALGFVILTAARSSEVRGARWQEVDMANACWTLPAERMKSGREHRVPISAPAKAILADLLTLRRGKEDLIFPGGRPGRPLSDVALAKALDAAGFGDATVHGFRSSFRDWAAEATNYPREVAEQALAHVLSDKVEAAYRRSDLFERRSKMMGDWAIHCIRMPAAAGQVVPIRAVEAG